MKPAKNLLKNYLNDQKKKQSSNRPIASALVKQTKCNIKTEIMFKKKF